MFRHLYTVQQIRKKLRERFQRDVSLSAIHYVAQKLGFQFMRIGMKRGYDISAYYELAQHFNELVEYDVNKSVKPRQTAQKQPNNVDYYTYNGERDNVDYGWENESIIRKAIIESINELNLIRVGSRMHLLSEGNDNEKRAKNYIRQANVCADEEGVHRFFDTIRNIFSSSDSKSYAYKHIQGIVKMVLGDGTPNNRGALCYDEKGDIILAKDGTPKLDDERIIKLMQRVNITADNEMSSGIRQFDNSFRKVGSNFENTFDEFVDSESLPSKIEYFNALVNKYGEFTTPSGYHIIKIPNFSTAKLFTMYMPNLCYLHRLSKYNSYGGDGKIFLALKSTLNDVEELPMKKVIFKNGGRMNDFATSAIGIALQTKVKKNVPYELVTITSRYSWKNGATNHDYDFNELSKILGFDVTSWLTKECGNSNLVLNVPKEARVREELTDF